MRKNREEAGTEGRRIPINDKRRAGEDAAEETAEAPPEAAGVVAAEDIEALKAELEAARAEAREYQDKYLRVHAETENFKKRMTREGAEREKYYNEGIIKELLPVMDNLERAIAHADENGDAGGLIDGVRMVKKQLGDALAKFGVSEVQCIGLPFNPESQQAMMQVETEEYDEGTVMEVYQKGYFLNERILRPAMVVVSKRPSNAQEGE